MNQHVLRIKERIAPLREQIIQHEVYSTIKTVDDLQLFMEQHIFAVWDFMSLLKSLQNKLTCTRVPWLPVGNADTRFLINEIVVGEESDIDLDGTRKSHFELYLSAMKQANASVEQIERFIAEISKGGTVQDALSTAGVSEKTRQFVCFTFDVINSNKPHLQAAVFTFGREDLIPDMFLSIVEDLYQRIPESISVFKYYLERHIEVDGDHHSHLALQMTENLCGEGAELWQEAEEAIVESLKMRILLWDGIYDNIVAKNARVI